MQYNAAATPSSLIPFFIGASDGFTLSTLAGINVLFDYKSVCTNKWIFLVKGAHCSLRKTSFSLALSTKAAFYRVPAWKITPCCAVITVCCDMAWHRYVNFKVLQHKVLLFRLVLNESPVSNQRKTKSLHPACRLSRTKTFCFTLLLLSLSLSLPHFLIHPLLLPLRLTLLWGVLIESFGLSGDRLDGPWRMGLEFL